MYEFYGYRYYSGFVFLEFMIYMDGCLRVYFVDDVALLIGLKKCVEIFGSRC